MAGLISSLFIKLTADTGKFETGMNRAGRKLTTTQKKFAAASKAARNFGLTLGGIVSVGAMTRIANGAIQAGSAITDMAIATNTGVEQLQSLTFAARKAGATQEQMANLLVRVQKSAADAARGLSTSRDAFAKLNINVDRFLKLSPEQMLESVGRALVQAEGDVTAYGAALDLLGTRNAPKLMEVMKRLGTEGFGSVADAARQAGQVMSEELAQKMDDAADRIEEFKTRMTVVSAEIVGAIMKVSDAFNALTTSNDNLRDLNNIYGAYLGGSGISLPAANVANSNSNEVVSPGGQLVAVTNFRKSQALNGEILQLLSAQADIVSGNIAIATHDVLESFKQWKTGLENAKPVLDRVAESTATWLDDAAVGVTSIATALEDGLVNAARDGKAAFGDMAQYIIAEIQRIAIRALVLRPLFGALGGFFGGPSTALGSAFGSAFGGGKAIGGPVSAGKTYMVGERGPELVTMGANGHVTPNDKLGGGPTIYADMRGASVEAVARLERFVGELNGSLESRAVAAVTDQRGRNPSFLSR